MGEELKLLVRTSSPYTLRIVWALKLKGLEYDIVYEDHSLANESSLLLEEISPIHKNLPVLLIHGGKPTAEPLVILEYIDGVWKQNPLLSQDPYQRAVARFWVKFAEDKVLPSIINVFVRGNRREEAIGELEASRRRAKGKEILWKGKCWDCGHRGWVDCILVHCSRGYGWTLPGHARKVFPLIQMDSRSEMWHHLIMPRSWMAKDSET
ncbi:glutathione S-transferase U7-like [Cucurbita maxima]|uniref:Glutathione S-transferase U7-like n=1 Tax=Cucurbita maxima TaxID=3661 RepID=A0A6J1IZ85_CUCMA|nr:glutathione S-transferase U7-like [Cucurbita maxima]